MPPKKKKKASSPSGGRNDDGGKVSGADKGKKDMRRWVLLHTTMTTTKGRKWTRIAVVSTRQQPPRPRKCALMHKHVSSVGCLMICTERGYGERPIDQLMGGVTGRS